MTTVGRIITMISSVFGIAIIALPSGIITAGLMEEILKQRNADSPEAEKAPEGPLAKDYDFNSKTPDLLMQDSRVYTNESQ